MIWLLFHMIWQFYYMCILFTISIIVDVLYISYIVQFTFIFQCHQIWNEFFYYCRISNIMYSIFLRKNSTVFWRIDAAYVYFLYTYDIRSNVTTNFSSWQLIDFLFAHPFRCRIIFIKFVKHFPFSSVSYVARQWSKKKKKENARFLFFKIPRKLEFSTFRAKVNENLTTVKNVYREWYVWRQSIN